MTELDQILDRISDKTMEIKEMSIDIGRRLDLQTEMIDTATKKTEDVTLELRGTFIPVRDRNAKAIVGVGIGIIATSLATAIAGPVVVPIIAVPCMCAWIYKTLSTSSRDNK